MATDYARDASKSTGEFTQSTRDASDNVAYMPGRTFRGNALTEEEQKHVRAVLSDLYRELGTQSKMEERIGIRQQTISKVMNSKEAPGRHFAEKLANALGRTYQEVVGVQAPARALHQLPGWAEAEAKARTDSPHLAPFIDQIREIKPPLFPTRVTPQWIQNFALLWSISEPQAIENTG